MEYLEDTALDFAQNMIYVCESQWNKKIDCAKAFFQFSKVDLRLTESLNSFGYETIEIQENRADICHSISISILLWLWDCERNQSKGSSPCIFVVSSNERLIPLLKQLKERNVFIVVVVQSACDNKEVWGTVANAVISAQDVVSSAAVPARRNSITPDYSTSSSQPHLSVKLSVPAEAVPFRGVMNPSDPMLDWRFDGAPVTHDVRPDEQSMYECGLGRPHVSMGLNPPPPPPPPPGPPSYPGRQNVRDEIEVIRDEQRALQDDLANAVRTRNVQVAVSTLRKIYTKQYKGFRIPAILTNIAQQQEAMNMRSGQGTVPRQIYTEASFVLGCIQWCFGGQKGDNMESFTYKMNKNIARWLIKDLQRKELHGQVRQEIIPLAVTAVQNILRQVAELELAMDLLTTLQVPDPLRVLMPFIYTWGHSNNPMVAQRVRSFSLEQGITPAATETWGKGHTERSSPSPQPGTSSVFEVHRAASFPAPIFEDQFQFSAPRVGRQSSPALTDEAMVNYRLLSLLKRAPHGLLGARIPDIYVAEYGEVLQMQNRKLKDVLLSLESVEMVGVDGPGDKLFRYVDKNNMRYLSR